MRISSVVIRAILAIFVSVGMMEAASSVFDYYLVSFDGKSVPLKQFEGKVLLIVNLATKTEYKDQIAKLEALYEKYESQGLVVVGVPSNDFGAAQPETPADLAKLYASYKLKFPLFAKSVVTGKDQIPLYVFLTGGKKTEETKADAKDDGDKKETWPTAGEVPWNFTKYLIDRNGKPVARFDADSAPDSPELIAAIEDALKAKAGSGENGTQKATRESVRAR